MYKQYFSLHTPVLVQSQSNKTTEATKQFLLSDRKISKTNRKTKIIIFQYVTETALQSQGHLHSCFNVSQPAHPLTKHASVGASVGCHCEFDHWNNCTSENFLGEGGWKEAIAACMGTRIWSIPEGKEVVGTEETAAETLPRCAEPVGSDPVPALLLGCWARPYDLHVEAEVAVWLPQQSIILILTSRPVLLAIVFMI